MKLNRLIILLYLVFMVGLCSCSDSGDDDPINDDKPPIEDENPDPWTGLQIVMFTPSDVELPEDYKERMKEVTDYSEWFFKKWMNHWGYECENPLKMHRDEDGYPILWRIKGEHNDASGKYDNLNLVASEVIEEANKKYKIPKENQTWWIISYPGPSQKAFKGGGDFRGGRCFANFTEGTGALISPEDDNLAAGSAATFKLKAMIHEMTHALGMGHLGPRELDGFGNSLMGPTNNAYHKEFPEDDRVYLSEAASAMLWKHPLFSGNFEKITQTPDVAFSGFNSTYDRENKVLQISGKLDSEAKAHSVVIRNESRRDKSEYWHKTYSARLNEDGTFTCMINQPTEAGGKLLIAFCFENGAVSGVTGKFGLNKGISKAYSFENDDFKFDSEQR
ncbi:MAG: hypothetical protein N4A74_17720 [Carboxylicivirga sp.]|jgi:hypothetical protein|nr:hypothetical protein [Carboxylicivirga sp.]